MYGSDSLVLVASSGTVFLLTFELQCAAAIGRFGLRERTSPTKKERDEDRQSEGHDKELGKVEQLPPHAKSVIRQATRSQLLIHIEEPIKTPSPV